MSDFATDLMEFTEYQRLLFNRIRNKLGRWDENNCNFGAIVDLPDEILTNLFIESSEVFELHTTLLGVTHDSKIKMKWMGLYTTALAKETHARIIWEMFIKNMIDSKDTEYNNLLSESKEEKDNLIKLLNKK